MSVQMPWWLFVTMVTLAGIGACCVLAMALDDIERRMRRGVEQWSARRPHKPEIGGSNPPPAPILLERRRCDGIGGRR